MLPPGFHQPELTDWRKQSMGELGKAAQLGAMLGQHLHPPQLAGLPTVPFHSWEKAFD